MTKENIRVTEGDFWERLKALADYLDVGEDGKIRTTSGDCPVVFIANSIIEVEKKELAGTFDALASAVTDFGQDWLYFPDPGKEDAKGAAEAIRLPVRFALEVAMASDLREEEILKRAKNPVKIVALRKKLFTLLSLPEEMF